MESIRWSFARDAALGDTGNQLLIDISGLAPGSLYNVQLLVNEGKANERNRRWDIAVDGALVVDDFSSEGGTGTWTPNNSFAYSGSFDPGADGVLNIVFDDDIGGDPFKT